MVEHKQSIKGLIVSAKKHLEAIAANPEKDAPRLAYAAWLRKRNQHRQAEYLRLDCKIAAFGRQRNRKRLSEASWKGLRKDEWRLHELRRLLPYAWLGQVMRELVIPSDLSADGRKAVALIRDFLVREKIVRDVSIVAFESPVDYPNVNPSAVLIVHHSEGALGWCFAPGHGEPDFAGKMWDELGKIGLWVENQDGCTSAIYPDSYPGFAIGFYSIEQHKPRTGKSGKGRTPRGRRAK